ncbi:hypothetical protein Hanom_Chr17g01571631 [Helianthus anomalus]
MENHPLSIRLSLKSKSPTDTMALSSPPSTTKSHRRILCVCHTVMTIKTC